MRTPGSFASSDFTGQGTSLGFPLLEDSGVTLQLRWNRPRSRPIEGRAVKSEAGTAKMRPVSAAGSSGSAASVKYLVAHRAVRSLLHHRGAKAALVDVLQERCNDTTTALDLSWLGLRDNDMVVVTSLLATHPSLERVNLSGNPFGNPAGKLVLDAVRKGRAIEWVALEDTNVSPSIIEAVTAATTANASRKRRLEAIHVEREKARYRAEAEEEVQFYLDALMLAEARGRGRLEEEIRRGRRDLLLYVQHSLAEMRKTEGRRVRRARYRSMVGILVEEEAVERNLRVAQEALALQKVYAVWMQCERIGLEAMERQARHELRMEAKQHWLVTRRAEKRRLQQEHNERERVEEQESNMRAALAAELSVATEELTGNINKSYRYHLYLQHQREEKEAAEERRRKQEELRREKERQYKLEREARRQQEWQIERDREARAESGKRASIEREQATLCEALLDLLRLDRAVAQAKVELREAEVERTKFMQTPPTVKLIVEADAPTAHYVGSGNTPLPPFDVTLGIHLPPPRLGWCIVDARQPPDPQARWGEVIKACKDARKALRSRVVAAAEAVAEHLHEWAPILYPTLEHTKRRKGKGADWPPADAVPTVSYTTGDLNYPPISSADQLKEKLGVLGGTLTISVNNAEDFDCLQIGEHHHLLCPSPRVAPKKGTLLPQTDPLAEGANQGSTLQFTIPPNSPLANITYTLYCVLYKCTQRNLADSVEREITVSLDLLFPTVSPDMIDASGILTRADALTGKVAVKTSAVFSIAVIHPILAVPESAMVQYYEDTPPDKVSLVEHCTVKPLPTVHWASSDKTRILIHPSNPSLPSFDKCQLRVHFTEGATPDDQILLRMYHDDDIALVGGLHTFPRPLTIDGAEFGTVTEGMLLSHREVQERHDAGARPLGGSGFTIVLEGPYARPATITKFLKRLRFVNYSQNPSEDIRVVEIMLIDPRGFQSIVSIRVEVVGDDDPTTMQLACHRLFYRQGSPSVPETLRKYLRQAFLPVFEGATVTDVDTDRFVGGSLVVTLHQGQKGDELCLYPDFSTGTPISVVEAPDKKLKVMYEGRCVGTLDSGYGYPTLSEGGEWVVPCEGLEVHKARVAEPGPLCSVVRVNFADDGSASIASVQQLMRTVAFTNIHYSPAEGWRQITVDLQVGCSLKTNRIAPEGSPPVLHDKVELRVAPPLLNVPGTWKTDYREGSGTVRLAPFEVVQDKEGWAEHGYGGGCLWLEMVVGASEEDVLNVKCGTLNEDLRAELRRGVKGALPTSFGEVITCGRTSRSLDGSTNLGSGGDGETSSFRKSGSEILDMDPEQEQTDDLGQSMQLNRELFDSVSSSSVTTPIKDRTRVKIQELVKVKKERRRSLLRTAREGVPLLKKGLDEKISSGSPTVSDVWIGKKSRVGSLVIGRGSLFLQFAKRGVGRKEVLAVLKGLTYANLSSDPQVLNKIARVTLMDRVHSISQALVQIEIQSVDDVTEIRLENPRPRYRPGSLTFFATKGAWPVAPLYRAALVDPDTTHFDGGSITIELVGGGVKGDVLTFMTVEQQKRARELALGYLKSRTKRTTTKDITDIPVWEGTIEQRGNSLVTDKGVVVARIDPLKSTVAGCTTLKIKFARSKTPMVTLDMASYLLNCISFSCSLPLSVGQRTYAIRVSDGDNPTEGKARLTIDVAKPLIAAIVDKGPSHLFTRVVKEPRENFALLDKVSVNLGDMKRDASLTSGYFRASIIEPLPGDELQFNTAQAKDGGVHVNGEFVGRLTAGATSLHIEFGWASKVSARTIHVLLTDVCLKTSLSGRRVVEFQCTDGPATDPSCIHCTVDVK